MPYRPDPCHLCEDTRVDPDFGGPCSVCRRPASTPLQERSGTFAAQDRQRRATRTLVVALLVAAYVVQLVLLGLPSIVTLVFFGPKRGLLLMRESVNPAPLFHAYRTMARKYDL